MNKTLATIGLTLALGAASQAGLAADAFAKEIKARKALMQIYSFNLGLLGVMAKDKAPYDAKVASAAAQNLLAASKMDNGAMWPEGSDVDAPGLKGKTRAKPDIWSTYPEVSEKGEALTAALAKMAAEAGTSVDAVKANMDAVGKGCKGCHESFRAPKPK